MRRFGVSLMTVWRDLTGLEDAGQALCARRGHAPLERRPEPGPFAEPFYTSKQVINQAKKDRIARYEERHDRLDASVELRQVHLLVRRVEVVVGQAEAHEHDRRAELALEDDADRNRAALADVDGFDAEAAGVGSGGGLDGGAVERG